MKVVVQFSGGKDSAASLIWAVEKYGASNVIAQFSDTGWESSFTYNYVEEFTNVLNVPLVVCRKTSMVKLAIERGRFASSMARFCTQVLKVHAMIDWVLDTYKQPALWVQGIRWDESDKRAKMPNQCRMFRHYIEPYTDKKGKKRFHTYRSDEVREYLETINFVHPVIRPVIDKTADQVIRMIQDKDLPLNPLYYFGQSRVGCYPCHMVGLEEIYQLSIRDPDRINYVAWLEERLGTTFFPPNKIPVRYCSKKVERKRIKNPLELETIGGGHVVAGKYVMCPTIKDVVRYVHDQRANLSLFEDKTQPPGCFSHYHICE